MDKIKYRAKYHKWRKENNYSIITNDNLELFFLDDISTEAYALFIEPKDLGETVKILIDELGYDVKKEVLQRDVRVLVTQLISLNLMEVI